MERLGSLGRPRCDHCRLLPALRRLQVSHHVSPSTSHLLIRRSCITARRRRRLGRQPFYGTGWAARPGQPTAQPYYNNNQNYNHPPPQYTPQPQNQGYYGSNQGYYGSSPYGQQQGVELQSPQPTHTRGGDDVYAPPAGPPPGKGDGIIR